MHYINLKNNRGFKWHKNNNTYVKGFAYTNENKLLEDKLLSDYFLNIEDIEDFEDRLNSLNGLFTVVSIQNDTLYIAVDKLRVFPIFYTIKDEQIYISDIIFELKNNNKINDLAVAELLNCRFANKKYTIFDNIFQVQSGELLVFNNGHLDNKIYKNYITDKVEDGNFKTYQDKFLNVLDNITQRAISFANGRTIVVPLSGGYDSRLIVSMLKKYNYENVICYTYGRRDSSEVKISNKVAKEIGFKWIFVEYNEKTVPKNYISDEKFLEYVDYASNGVSIPHIQDYFAVKYMHDNGMLPDDSIFMPGHSGDLIGGSNLSVPKSTKDTIIKNIMKKQYILNNIRMNDMKNITLKHLEHYNIPENFYYSVDDNYNISERQAKFIVNSCRVYELFGYKFYLPLWDNEIYELFKMMPVELKENLYLYNKTIIDKLFTPLNIDFLKKQEIPKGSFVFKIRELLKYIIKTYFPTQIKNKIIEKSYKDNNNYTLISEPMKNDIDIEFPSTNINGILGYWYINKRVKSL